MESKLYTLLLFLLILSSSFNTKAQCNNVSLQSQAEVNAYPAVYGCANVTGTLNIIGADITSLDSLYQIETVGNLLIHSNPQLADLTGLSSLTSVQSIEVFSNNGLQNLTGLSSLSRVNGHVTINTNAALHDLTGLSGLTYVSAEFSVDYNPNLTSLAGLSNINYAGTIQLSNNPVLADISAFSNLTRTAYLTVRRCNQLTTLAGLQNLTYLQQLEVSANASLTNIDALSNVDSLRGAITIMDNPALQNLNGLAGVRHVSDILIRNNNVLTSAAGLHSIQSAGLIRIEQNPLLSDVGLSSLATSKSISLQSNNAITNLNTLASLRIIDGGLTIMNHPSLTSITGLSGVQSTTLSEIIITSCPHLVSLAGLEGILTAGIVELDYDHALTNLQGLSGLTSITGAFQLLGNNGLLNLNSLSNLQSIGGDVSILSNPILQNLSGLEGLTTVPGNFTIQGNQLLANLDALSALTSIGGDLHIAFDPSLTNFHGLSSLTTIGKSFWVELNDGLTSFQGMDKLTSIGHSDGDPKSLVIQSNQALTSLQGLEHITSLSGSVNIIDDGALLNLDGLSALKSISTNSSAQLLVVSNNSLANIDGLSSLTSVQGTTVVVRLMNNPALTRCCGLYPLLSSNGAHGTTSTTITISGNGAGCTQSDIVEGGPCNQGPPPAGLTFEHVTPRSMRLSFAADPGSTEGYVIFMRAFQSPSPGDVPEDGQQYHVGQVIGTSTIVVGVGTDTKYTITSQEPNTDYYFDVYSVAAGKNYDTDHFRSGHQATTADVPYPADTVSQPTHISFSNVTNNTMTVSFDPAANDPDGYITLLRAHTSPYPEDEPEDGVAYEVGNVLGSSTIVVGFGISTSLDIVYLDGDIEYYYDVFSYRYTEQDGYDYVTQSPLGGHQRTTPNETMAVKQVAYPNPFSEHVTFPFSTKETSDVSVVIFDQLGREIARLDGDSYDAGDHNLRWDRTDKNGNKVQKGMYFYSIKCNEKMLVTMGRLMAN